MFHKAYYKQVYGIKGTMINKVKGPSRKSGKPLKLGGSISAER